MLTLVVSHQWSIKQLDINNAFLNGYLEEDIYMKQSNGFVDEKSPHFVCIHSSLYGLNQAH